MQKKAIITGITGQDGAYLCQFLIERGYEVVGCYRRSSNPNFWRLKELKLISHERLILSEYDVTDSTAAIALLKKHQPDEVYNLAAQSFVVSSFSNPTTTTQINSLGTLNLLEAIKLTNPKIKFYQASTSEMFGKIQSKIQSETTPFYPRSPYAASKLYAHWITINYRESYSLFAACGILFNHESPLRGSEFVTRKITISVARIKNGLQKELVLGNLNAKRDWGYAKDYVEGMWKMLQTPKPGTYILATGRNETIRNFAKMAFKAADINIEFLGHNEKEYGIDKKTGKVILRVNKEFYRPAEVDVLLGDPTLAKNELNWQPKTSLEDLASMMVLSDLKRQK